MSHKISHPDTTKPVTGARVTLRAYRSAPARVELIYNSVGRRALLTGLWLIVCWGAIPMLIWMPPHYPWVTAAFFAGIYLAVRSWRGRFTIRSFAGVCPRCGGALALGVDRTVDLPHTLTCFNCHFEPVLEVGVMDEEVGAVLEHNDGNCLGRWGIRWLADEAFVYCDACHAGIRATPAVKKAADQENDAGDLMKELADDGWPLI